jgi:hypothetical protein
MASCPFASWIWYKIHRWFGISFVVLTSISSLFESFLVPYRKGKVGLKGGVACLGCRYLGALVCPE